MEKFCPCSCWMTPKEKMLRIVILLEFEPKWKLSEIKPPLNWFHLLELLTKHRTLTNQLTQGLNCLFLTQPIRQSRIWLDFQPSPNEQPAIYKKKHMYQFWTVLEKFGPVWSILDKFGQFLTSYDKFRRVWKCLDKFGPIQTSLGHFGQS